MQPFVSLSGLQLAQLVQAQFYTKYSMFSVYKCNQHGRHCFMDIHSYSNYLFCAPNNDSDNDQYFIYIYVILSTDWKDIMTVNL